MIDPHVRHNIAAGHGHRARRAHRIERDRRPRELFLPTAQRARNDIEIAEEVIDAKQIRERGACGAADVVGGRQYCLHLVMGGRAEIFKAGRAARLRDCSIRIGGIEPRQAQQVAGAHRCRTEPHVLRWSVIDDLLSGFGAVANRRC